MADKKLTILVIGSGGREHAVVRKLSQSNQVSRIYCAPGNAGTALLAQNIDIGAGEIKKLAAFARKTEIDLTFVGPEEPLILGIADYFEKRRLPVVGPSKKASRIEGSKVFSKRLMAKYGIPTADFKVFSDVEKAHKYLRSHPLPVVIKADGQCLGKGVAVINNYRDGEQFLDKLMVKRIFGPSGRRVIIEECLFGTEVSIMVVTDGRDYVTLLPSQDHKRVNDGDLGPNTGGMGAYCPLPLLKPETMKIIESKIIRPSLRALSGEGSRFKGILYPGLILTPKGPYVLEYNCRLGDPETQPVLSLLKTDLVTLFRAVCSGSVGGIRLSWHKKFAVCVNLVSGGYPGSYKKGLPVSVKSKEARRDAIIYHSGTGVKNGKTVTSGGRVLGITGIGSTLKSAIKNAYAAIGPRGAFFPGMHYRSDIGRKGLVKKLWQMQ